MFDPGHIMPSSAGEGFRTRLDGREAIADWLERAAFVYLALPVLIFVLAWFTPALGVTLAVALVIGLRPVFSGRGGPSRAMESPWTAAIVVTVAIMWAALGGAGHLFFANADWPVRDAVLRDLVIGTWPVGYGQVAGHELLLRAPIGYYLPAAIVGKVLGPEWADLALLFWTAAGVAIFLGLAVSNQRRVATVCIFVAVLVCFSGMDLLGTVLRGGWMLAKHLQWTDHLEWWARRFQYSSHTTQLFWVPNHALPGWIATALLVRNLGRPRFAASIPILVGVLPLWSPLTAVGFLPLAAIFWLQSVSRSFRSAVDWPALVASFAVVLPISVYLVMGAAEIHAGATVVDGEPMWFYIPHLLQFVLLEVGILWLLLLMVRRDPLLIVSGLILWALPFVGFGPSNDLAMRASIPALMFIALAAADVVIRGRIPGHEKVYVPIVVILLLGAPTAVTEIVRSVTEPVWKPDYSHSLIPSDSTSFPAHYAAALGKSSWFESMLRPAHDVNRRGDRSQGGAGER